MLAGRRAYATIPAADLGRAKAWYKDKLGLAPSVDTPMIVLYGDSGFAIYPTPNAGKAPNTLMSFESDDVDSDVKALRAKGVKFEDYDMPGLKTVNGIATMGQYKSAWFKDSEGNILAIATPM